MPPEVADLSHNSVLGSDAAISPAEFTINDKPGTIPNSRDFGGEAVWTLSSAKPGNGIDQLRDGDEETFWQSEGSHPHFINIQFYKKVVLNELCLYLDYEGDESYTPRTISIRCGMAPQDLVEIRRLTLKQPSGWVNCPLSGPSGEKLRTHCLQVSILTMHQNGRDTHIRLIKVFGPWKPVTQVCHEDDMPPFTEKEFTNQCGVAVEAFIGSTRSLCYGYRQRPCGLTRRHGRGVGSYSVSDRSQLPLIPQWDKRLPSGAGSTSMGLAERFFRVAKANLNAILKRWEDPEKVLDQTLNDMQTDVTKVRQSYAEVTATQKRLERQRQHAEGLADEWYNRAQLAMEKMDEPLAREALTRRRQKLETAQTLAAQLDVQGNALSQLYTSMQQLEAKINEARGKKDQLVARARTAKTTQSVNDMLGGVGGTSSIEAFERMHQKVEVLEAAADVSAEMIGGTSVSLEERFKELEGSSGIDDDLNKLRAALPGQPTAPVLELPGRSKDLKFELEQMKKEIARE